MAGAHDPRRPVHVDADVSLLCHGGLPGVDTDPDTHWALGERGLGIGSGGNGVARARERYEERVALRVHLAAAVP